MDGETYTLKTPIETRFKQSGTGDERVETITEVKFLPFKAKDLLVTDQVQGKIAQTIALIAVRTGLTRLQVGEMGDADFSEVSARVWGFPSPGSEQ